MPDIDSDVRVERTTDRYEIRVDDEVAGFTRFSAAGDGALRFVHTEIDRAFSGRGLGSTLVAQAMADVAARGERVVPLCPFVVAYLREHEVPGLRVEWPPTDGDA